MSRQRRDPSELTLPEAFERFLGRKRNSKAKSTVQEYGYRLNRLGRWADEETDIEVVGELHPLDFDDYLAARERDGVKAITMQKHFTTVREFVQFLESLGAVDEGLSNAVPDVDVPTGGDVDETMLAPEDGDPLIRYYRDRMSGDYGTKGHALLELFWFVGCRLGAARGLDLRDVNLENQSVEFHHRPDQDTPLKQGKDGERAVAISEETTAVLRHYIDHKRTERRDEYGRRPLFTTENGRAGTNTVRCWCYLATQPCIRTACPHDRQRRTCDYVKNATASQCPSSRSPTQVRTGAITRMLNRLPRDRVRHRANTQQWQNYDQASENEKMEERDRSSVPKLALDADTEDDDS